MKLFGAILFLISSISFGQSSGLGPSPGAVGMGSMLPYSFALNLSPSNLSYINITEIEIVNSPFLEEAYQEGKTTIQGRLGFTAKMRYNAGKDVVEFVDEDHITKELLRRPYISAEFGGKKYLIMDYLDNDKEKLGYFNPLTEGKAQLLLAPKKKLELSKYSFQERREAFYRDASAYFIKIGSEPAANIILSKANILKILDPTYQKVLTHFISENDLKLRKEEDVVKLIDYYNTLISKNVPSKQIRS